MARRIEDRAAGLGGTDAGVIAGLSRYKTPFHLYLEKRRELPADMQLDDDDEFKEWGRYLEDPIAKRVAARTGRKLWRPGRTIRHPRLRFLTGHPDRFQRDLSRPPDQTKGVLEIKTAMFTKRKEWERDGIPAPYYLQLQHYLLITGLSWGSFAVLFGGNKLIIFDVPRDERVIAALMEIEVEFWAMVQTERPPEPTFDALGAKLVALLYKDAAPEKEIVLATDEARGKAFRLLNVKAAIKSREQTEQELEAWFKYQMADAAKCFIPGAARLSWPTIQKERFDEARFAADHPDLASAYRAPGSYRRFSIKALDKTVVDFDEEEDAAQPVMTARRIVLE